MGFMLSDMHNVPGFQGSELLQTMVLSCRGFHDALRISAMAAEYSTIVLQ